MNFWGNLSTLFSQFTGSKSQRPVKVLPDDSFAQWLEDKKGVPVGVRTLEEIANDPRVQKAAAERQAQEAFRDRIKEWANTQG